MTVPLEYKLRFPLLLLLSALAAGACHPKRTPPPTATAPKAHAQVRPASARTPPRPSRTPALKTWGFEPQGQPEPDPASPPPKPPPSADTTVYDTTPSRLPMWRQRAKNY
jgi:hypothetical protein